ncbi:MAG: AI-2E family transporter [Tissierellia bacterium]|nr:AI-2E family transporter [Tissierellia bacterium]
MKIRKNNKYFTISVYAFLVIAASALFIVFLGRYAQAVKSIKKFFAILSPFVIGASIAYILNFLLKFYQNKLFSLQLFNKLKKDRKNSLAIAMTYLTVVIVIIGLMYYIIPQSVKSATKLIENTPEYARNVTLWVGDTIEKLNLNEEIKADLSEKLFNFQRDLNKNIGILIPKLGIFLKDAMSKFTEVILGFIISIYILIEKEKFAAQSKMILYSSMEVKSANSIIRVARRMDDIMKKFFIGRSLDSLIVGIAFFIVLFLMKLEYAGLMAFILGVTNIIPWVGPWLGMIPSAIIVLFQSPIKVIWFLIAVVIIQQIDGNILAPRIHGNSLGVSAFWIVFSILIGGKLFGFIGMLVGIPVFVLIYSLFKEYIETKLREKNLPDKSSDYISFDLNENLIKDEIEARGEKVGQ